MKNGAFIVFKKELARFFGDRRLLFTSVIMPGLLIYILYSLMGNSMNTMMEEQTSRYIAAAVNVPQSISEKLVERKFELHDEDLSVTDDIDIDIIKEKLENKEYALCIVFPDDFESAIENYDPSDKSRTVPNVEIYYNSADINSANAFSQAVAVLDSFENDLSNVFDINNLGDSKEDVYDIATNEDAAGTVLSMILPMLLMTLMYSSCVALAPESIAGEKERGTLAALLITPVPRSQIILGKVAALSAMALLGGLSSFLGTFLSIPKLMGSMGDQAGELSTNIYRASDYFWLAFLILTTVLLFITLISIISTVAKTVKEAGTLVMPLMLVVMFLSFMTMYQTETRTEFYWYFIPIFNTIECMTQIFSFSVTPVDLVVTSCTNIICSALGIFLLTKLFDNERVMFNS